MDFEKDVAFVAVVGPRENEEIVGTGAYFLNPSTNLAEVAYMIVPEWQGSGLGAALQQRLKEFAVDQGVRGFVAEFLQANSAMLNLAKRLGKIEIKTENGSLPRHFAIRINDWRGACVPALRDVFIPKPLRQLSLHAAGIKLASGVFVPVHSVPLTRPGALGLGHYRAVNYDVLRDHSRSHSSLLTGYNRGHAGGDSATVNQAGRNAHGRHHPPAQHPPISCFCRSTLCTCSGSPIPTAPMSGRGRRSPRSTGPPKRTPRWRVSLHNNAGWARFDAGDYPGAIAEFELAKNAATRWGTPQQVAWADEAFAEAREAGR